MGDDSLYDKVKDETLANEGLPMRGSSSLNAG